VSATPVFFINGRPLVGAHGLGTFVQLIEEERSRAESLIAGGVARRDVYHRVTARGRPRASSIPDGADLVPPPRLDPDGLYQVGLGDPSQRKGREEALVTIVEFGDFNCGYCAKVQPVLAELARSYGDEVRFAFRHMPRGSDESRVIAEAALAAGEQGRFWDMHDRLFNSEGRLDRPALEQIARDLSLDMGRFRSALDRRQFSPQVSLDAAEAARLGVRGTPTFFINGSPLIGARSEAEFRALVDRKLAEARALIKRGVPRGKIYQTVTKR
jgi:protein-disulfide isomerase